MSGAQLTSNATEVARAFARAASELNELDEPNTAAAEIISAAPMPVRTGALAASVRAGVTANGVTAAGLVRYWTFVEWGAPRRHVAAQHPIGAQLVNREAEIIAVYHDYAATVAARVGD